MYNSIVGSIVGRQEGRGCILGKCVEMWKPVKMFVQYLGIIILHCTQQIHIIYSLYIL